MVDKNHEITGNSLIMNDRCLEQDSFLKVLDKKRKEKASVIAEDNNSVVNFYYQQLLISRSVNGGGKTLTESKIENSHLMHNLKMQLTSLKEFSAKPDQKYFLAAKNLSPPQTGEGYQHHMKAHNIQGNNLFENNGDTSVHSTKMSEGVGQPEDKTELAALKQPLSAPLSQWGTGLPAQQATSRSETVHRPLSMTQQRIKHINRAESAIDIGAEKQVVALDYQFQGWTGAHSVKVSIPTELNRESNITLFPSDARVADALLRNIEHTMRRMPALVEPQQDKDEREREREEEDKE